MIFGRGEFVIATRVAIILMVPAFAWKQEEEREEDGHDELKDFRHW